MMSGLRQTTDVVCGESLNRISGLVVGGMSNRCFKKQRKRDFRFFVLQLGFSGTVTRRVVILGLRPEISPIMMSEMNTGQLQ